MPTCIELFAGAGGLALGLKNAGFEHLLLVERDARIARTLNENGFDAQTADVSTIDFRPWRDRVDLLCGGPPCQPFSRGGLGRGAEDTRNGWELALDATEAVRPRALLFENVSSLMAARYTTYVESIQARLLEMGYHISWIRLDACEFGVPQHRKRVFLVGFLDAAALDDFDESYAREPRSIPPTTVRDMMTALGPPNGQNWHILRGNPRPYPNHTGSVMDRPSKTIVCGCNGVPGGMNAITLDDGTYRYYTVREAARLQTFPDTYKFSPTWSRAFVELGNAVPPLIGQLMGRLVARSLTRRSERPDEARDTSDTRPRSC
jgi:DNA (cytosine-5)-methyltransferase 1